MRRADRLIKMVHFIRGRRQAVTAQQIADEFEINKRTVYRDIADLMANGAPISGEAGVGYIIDKDYYLPPITFDGEELEALAIGMSMVRQWTDDGFAEKADSAFAKIQAVLPAQLQGELEQITTYSTLITQPAVPWTISFSALRECIRTRHRMQIEYLDGKGAVTLRVLRPLALIFASPVWLVATWCETRQDFRNFRLDRIQSLHVSNDRFEHETGKDLVAYKLADTL